MLLNTTYKDHEQDLKIAQQVGEAYSFIERIRMKGIGSPKITILKSDVKIYNLLQLDQNRNVCNIELRPKGILISFQKRLETYQLVIPYYKLTIFKGDTNAYTLHKDQYFVKLLIQNHKEENFMQRITASKAAESMIQNLKY